MAPVFHLPGLRCPFGNDFEHLPDIQPATAGKIQPLRQPLHQAGDADLIDHLGQLAAPHRSHQAHSTGVTIDDRSSLVKDLLRPAHHHSKSPVFGSCLTSRDRRIQKSDTAVGALGSEFPRHFS